MSRARCCILGQSSTATRTSSSTDSTVLLDGGEPRSGRSRGRSRRGSTTPPGCPAGAPSGTRRLRTSSSTSSRRPVTSRRTTNCGCTRRWMPRSCRRQLGGHGVDQEGHVVGDDLDDGVAAGPAVLVDRRREDPHVGGSLGPGRRQLPVRQRRPGEVDRVALGEVLGRHVPVVPADEGGQTLVVVARALRGLDGPGDDLAPLAVLRLRHQVRLHALAGVRPCAPSSPATLPSGPSAGRDPPRPCGRTSRPGGCGRSAVHSRATTRRLRREAPVMSGP